MKKVSAFATSLLLALACAAQTNITSSNIKDYAPTLKGQGASGEWDISVKKWDGHTLDVTWSESGIGSGSLLGINSSSVKRYSAEAVKQYLGIPVNGETLETITRRGSTTNGSIKVAGVLYAQKLKVDQPGWSDYVFDSAYRLVPLAQVAQFVKLNKHLPDVPTADSVIRNGIDVGANQALLLRKIEELTLYIIEQENRIKELEAQQAAASQTAALEKRLAELEKALLMK